MNVKKLETPSRTGFRKL